MALACRGVAAALAAALVVASGSAGPGAQPAATGPVTGHRGRWPFAAWIMVPAWPGLAVPGGSGHSPAVAGTAPGAGTQRPRDDAGGGSFRLDGAGGHGA